MSDSVPTAQSVVDTQGTQGASYNAHLSASNRNADSKRGAAYIYEDKMFPLEENGHKVLRNFERLFKDIGLETSAIVGQDRKLTARVQTKAVDRTALRRISVFLIWTRKPDPTNAARYDIKLEEILADLNQNFHPDSSKLLIFCREEDGFSSTEFDSDQSSIVPEEQWKKEHANLVMLYKYGDENNLYCFLDDLKCIIEHSEDSQNPGMSASIKTMVEKLKDSNTKKCFHSCGLSSSTELRIEAFRFEDRLLRNHPDVKKLQQFERFIVADMKSCYENNGDGRVLIISNEKFESENRRRGTRMDCENLNDLFQKLGFSRANIDIRHDLKAEDMMKAVEEFSAKGSVSCAILIILTHGCHGRLYGVDDHSWIPDVAVAKVFGSAPTLARRPKLLVINACRNPTGEDPAQKTDANCDTVRVSGTAESKQRYAEWFLATNRVTMADHSPDRAGMIVAYSTLPEEESSGLAYSGSRFISSLCWVFHQYANRDDVLAMINRVNEHVTSYKQGERNTSSGELDEDEEEEIRKQLPSWTVETTKKFFLVETQPASGSATEDNGILDAEVQCSLAALGCQFRSRDPLEMAVHYVDFRQQHSVICAQAAEMISSLETSQRDLRKENSDLRSAVGELREA